MGYIEEVRKLVGHRPLILVGAVVILIDDKGRLLLQERRFPAGKWGLAGGLMELGESTEDVARREVLEETGLQVGKLQLINVYSGPEHFVVAENGDQFYVVTVAYYSKEFKGDIAIDCSESVTIEFFAPDSLPENMVGSHRVIIEEFLDKAYRLL